MRQRYELWSEWDRPSAGAALAGDEELARENSRAWAAFFAEHLTRDRMSVLDAGAGSGLLSLLLAQQGHQVTAVDPSPLAVETARERFAAWGLPVETAQVDLAALPFPDRSFDAVVSWNALGGLEDPATACRELARVLCPGGTLAIGEDLPHRWRPLWDLQQLTVFGFTDIHIQLQGGASPGGFRIAARKGAPVRENDLLGDRGL